MKNLHPKTMVKSTLAVVISGLLFAASGPVFAKDIAGKTIIARGKVSAVETNTSTQRRLKRRSPIYGVDVVKTDANSKTQLRMTDGGMIALKENSELLISNYEFNKAENTGSVVMELVKGGLRSVTGAIKSDKGNYTLKTPVGSIGIRGTHYEIEIIQGEVFIAVWDGAVDISVEVGGTEQEVPLGEGEDFSYAKIDETGEVTELLVPPENFNEGHSSDPTTDAEQPAEEQVPEEEGEGEGEAGGGEAPPEGGGEEAPPEEGGEEAPPEEGGEEGGEEAPPEEGGEEAPPEEGGEEAPPEEGGEEAPPEEGGEETPPEGGTETPPEGGADTPAGGADTPAGGADTPSPEDPIVADAPFVTTEEPGGGVPSTPEPEDPVIPAEEEAAGDPILTDTDIATLVAGRSATFTYNYVAGSAGFTQRNGSNLSASMDIDFQTAEVKNGQLSFTDTESQNEWFATYEGFVNAHALELGITWASHGNELATGTMNSQFIKTGPNQGINDIFNSFDLWEINNAGIRVKGSFDTRTNP
jgi:hypothetical protein